MHIFFSEAYFFNQLGGFVRNEMNNVILPNIQQHDMQNRNRPRIQNQNRQKALMP